MIAFVQRKDGEWINANAFCAADGFRMLGVEVRGFESTELEALPLNSATIVTGYVGVVQRALERIGAPRPFVPDFPEALMPFVGRRIRQTTLGEVRRSDERVFIKPFRAQKAFTGYVRGRDVHDLGRSAHCDDDFEVIASEVVTFVSEWRCFVLGGECIGVRPYVQDYRTPPPDLRIVDDCIRAFVGAPAAYAIDLGRTDGDRTLLVEVNDAYSLGSYGLSSVLYAHMIEARWREMTGA